MTTSRHVSPLFTVAVATYGRGEKIAATLQSIAQQTIAHFEVLVVSDGPASAALRATVEQFDSRFKLCELSERTRSQSGPNNYAWARARGDYVAYLGHDDIWHPEHLEALSRVFASAPSPDFAISGALMIGPSGAVDELTWVSGIFPPTAANPGLAHFFPPSSVSHKRVLSRPIEDWPAPMLARGPVDSHFLLAAARTGCVFLSTEQVTVFKFNSALRYLSYLLPSDDEQQKILELCSHPVALNKFIEERVELTRRQGTYMFLEHPNPEDFEAGEVVRKYEQIRGIKMTENTTLTHPRREAVNTMPSGFDWHPFEGEGSHTWRWSGPSPRPRMALPFLCPVPVELRLHIIAFASEKIMNSLRLFVSGHEQEFALFPNPETASTDLCATIRLGDSTATVIELRMAQTISPHEMDATSEDTRQLGLCLAGMTLTPLDS
jgi:glycosyltransferase involved in cell wall biosynthesis